MTVTISNDLLNHLKARGLNKEVQLLKDALTLERAKGGKKLGELYAQILANYFEERIQAKIENRSPDMGEGTAFAKFDNTYAELLKTIFIRLEEQEGDTTEKNAHKAALKKKKLEDINHNMEGIVVLMQELVTKVQATLNLIDQKLSSLE